MFANLPTQPDDKILALVAAFRADPRDQKIDLGVGVYRDATGLTPVMQAVKDAEHALWESQDSKAYVALTGDPAFADAMAGLVLGGTVPTDHIAAAATPGGTGAIRQALELIKLGAPGATVWVSNPTWPNHPSIIKYLDMPMREYRYFDPATCAVDFDGMIKDLKQIPAGDVVLLHGCCHNPTGANLNMTQWAEVVSVLQSTGAIPMIDIAYQGFGDGLEADAQATQLVAQNLPETIIAASCSKNFGIYRERTGIVLAVSNTPESRGLTQANLAFLNRQNFSFPPDHGARLVTMILNDDTLKASWMAELEGIRTSMLGLREHLAQALQQATGSDRFGFVAQHRGMFSRLGLSAEQVAKLRQDAGVYMVGDSRINIAGLNTNTVPILAQAIAQVV